jgi:hypothetical protein
MPDTSRLELQAHLFHRGASVPIAFTTTYPDEATRAQALGPIHVRFRSFCALQSSASAPSFDEPLSPRVAPRHHDFRELGTRITLPPKTLDPAHRLRPPEPN